MKVRFQLDDEMGTDTAEFELPQVPSMGDTVVVHDRRFTVLKTVWMPEHPDSPVLVAATAK